MLAVAYYLLKVIICSGILYGYYRLALHNKVFHAWNRFYLLSAVAISLLLPLVSINILHPVTEQEGSVVKLLNVVTTGDAYVHEASYDFSLTSEQLALTAYVLVSFFFLTWMLKTILDLRKLIKQHQVQKIENIHFVNTEAQGTPFSFFRYIFWNRSIDPDSETGKKIFMHELVHVHEKHSADRVFMNLVLSLFWCNPFFWLIRREMNMIHEFIADSKSVEGYDRSSFAAMILQAAYPQHSFGLTSSFFTSSIKRRLMMLTKMENKKVSYFTRVLVLPLITFVFMAFALKIQKQEAEKNQNISFNKTFNIVIDAGHGGQDKGARSAKGVYEKDIALALAKKVAALNSNPNINIILSRDNDVFNNVTEKVNFAVQQQPDLFISLHLAADSKYSNTGKGFEIYLSRNMDTAAAHRQKARLLASIVTEEIEKTYKISKEIKQRKHQAISVLDAEQINYPAILVECGYITDSKDANFIGNEGNQEKIARNILKSIERYAQAMETGKISFAEPTIEKDLIIVSATKIDVKNFFNRAGNQKNPLLVVNGKETKELPASGIFEATSPDGTLDGIFYPKNNAKAIAKYGEAARFGAIIIEEVIKPSAQTKEKTLVPAPVTFTAISDTGKITFNAVETKQQIKQQKDTIPSKVATVDITKEGTHVIVIYENGKAERITKEEAVKRKLVAQEPPVGLSFRNNNGSGSTIPDDVLLFLDGKEITKEEFGTINQNEIASMHVWKGVDAVEKFGEKGRKGVIEIETKAYYSKALGEIRIIAFRQDSRWDKTETEPQFPGGEGAWSKHISRSMNQHIDALQKDKQQGTCIVQFNIDTDGSISKVEALTMKNSKLAEVAIEAVEKGPKWIPGTKQGKQVRASHTQAVTFRFGD